MPFTRMNQPPDSSTLLKPDGLVFMQPAQLEEEAAYWRKVYDIGGFLQMQLGQTFLTALECVVAYKKMAVLPSEQRPQPRARWVGNMALASLALAHLTRTAYTADVESGTFEPNADTPALDYYMRNKYQVAVMHHPRSQAGEVLPGFAPGERIQYYEDPLLVVRADAPATPTPNFVKQYVAVGDGREFDAATYITLTPLLKIDFIALPE
jgi:hypothetical protein